MFGRCCPVYPRPAHRGLEQRRGRTCRAAAIANVRGASELIFQIIWRKGVHTSFVQGNFSWHCASHICLKRPPAHYCWPDADKEDGQWRTHSSLLVGRIVTRKDKIPFAVKTVTKGISVSSGYGMQVLTILNWLGYSKDDGHSFPSSGRVGPLQLADVHRCVQHAMDRW